MSTVALRIANGDVDVWAEWFDLGDCWEWRGARNGKGYGLLRTPDNRSQHVHRFVYGALVAPVPSGLVMDHLCRNTSCANPDHLEPVTNRQNALRGIKPRRVCVNGHDTHDVGRTPAGTCRACMKIMQPVYSRRSKARRKAAA